MGYSKRISGVHIPSRIIDMSLPSIRASTPCGVVRSGTGGKYLTPKVETLEWAQAAGVGVFMPIGEGHVAG